MEGFRALYHIPRGVSLRYYSPSDWLTHGNEGEVVIPIIAFIEGGMTFPMDSMTRDYLITYRLCPHQCTRVDTLNEQMRLNLTSHDVVCMYECHLLANSGYYLKPRSSVVRLISCLPKSNKGMKDDYLIAFGEWHGGLHCPTQKEEAGGVP